MFIDNIVIIGVAQAIQPPRCHQSFICVAEWLWDNNI